jgi:uncharacterized protein (TIGR03790 family)
MCTISSVKNRQLRISAPRAICFLSLMLGICAALPINLFSADAGNEVVVIYNSRMPESKELAEYYAQRRHVPRGQVFGFELPREEIISRSEFRNSLQKPLAKALEKNKLWHVSSHVVPATNGQPARLEWRPSRSTIRYAVLCFGVPLTIQGDPHLKEAAAEQLRPELRRDEAAVDSELALLPLLDNNLPLSGPLPNPAYGTTNIGSLHPTNGVLLVSRLDGPDAKIARGLVDKALFAETNGLWGRAYFDLRNTQEPGYKLGDDWIKTAADLSRRFGFETIVDENPGTFPPGFPMSQIALYVGWYAEDACGPFLEPNVEFMPGAFAYHLHSYSAHTLRSSTKNWAGPLLEKGATATMGCVNEPYLGGTPDISVFIARFLIQGFSLGEAACASQSVLSWQTTVVGDPLYRPFGSKPEELHQYLEKTHSTYLAWSYLRLLDLNEVLGKPLRDLIALLEQLPLTKENAVLSEKLGDLYAEAGKPSSAVHEYQQALKLNPTPQQKLRLFLLIGDKLTGLNNDSEAFENYQNLLETYPEYPDRLTILNKLITLAKKLNKPAEVEKYQNMANPPASPKDKP